jgi:hypothetical protein
MPERLFHTLIDKIDVTRSSMVSRRQANRIAVETAENTLVECCEQLVNPPLSGGGDDAAESFADTIGCRFAKVSNDLVRFLHSERIRDRQ